MGRQQTQSTKDKISKANTGRVFTDERREQAKLRMIEYWKDEEYRKNQHEKHLGRKSPCGMKGKKHSIKSRIQISKSNTKNTEQSKLNSLKYYELRRGVENTLWREAVFARDNFTCQCCGDNKGKNLNAHHIRNFLNYEDLRTTISNGITLCKLCHIRFHKIYGLTHTNEQQLEEFLRDSLII